MRCCYKTVDSATPALWNGVSYCGVSLNIGRCLSLPLAIISVTQKLTIENLERLCSNKINVHNNIVSRWTLNRKKERKIRLEIRNFLDESFIAWRCVHVVQALTRYAKTCTHPLIPMFYWKMNYRLHGLQYRTQRSSDPDWHFVMLRRKRGAGIHVLYSDKGLKWFAALIKNKIKFFMRPLIYG